MVVDAVVWRAVERGQADIAEDFGQPAIADGHMGYVPARSAEVVRNPEHAWEPFLEGEMTGEENRPFHVTILREGIRRSAP